MKKKNVFINKNQNLHIQRIDELEFWRSEYTKRKFKIVWTEEMKNSLKETGWRLATTEEIKYLKLED